MDYMGILGKAWRVTWRYKALWVFGLFAGAGSSGGGNFNWSSGDFGSGGGGAPELAGFEQWLADNIALLIAGVAVLMLVAIAFLVLGIAARGGLIYLVNESEENRPVLSGTGWSVGFAHWGRTFLIGLLLALPMLVVIGVVVAAALITIIPVATTGGGVEDALPALGAGLCIVLPIALVAAVATSVVVAILYEIALRYGVLYGSSSTESIVRAWRDLVGKRGTFTMWLVMLLPQIAFSVVVLLVSLVFVVPILGLGFAGQYGAAVFVALLLLVVLLLPGAVYGTFHSSAWTVFFRRMNGMETLAAPAVAPAAGMPGGGYAPPPPPSYPPAPPAAPQAPYPPASYPPSAPPSPESQSTPEPPAATPPPGY